MFHQQHKRFEGDYTFVLSALSGTPESVLG